jgi:hypothetical protein
MSALIGLATRGDFICVELEHVSMAVNTFERLISYSTICGTVAERFLRECEKGMREERKIGR